LQGGGILNKTPSKWFDYISTGVIGQIFHKQEDRASDILSPGSWISSGGETSQSKLTSRSSISSLAMDGGKL